MCLGLCCLILKHKKKPLIFQGLFLLIEINGARSRNKSVYVTYCYFKKFIQKDFLNTLKLPSNDFTESHNGITQNNFSSFLQSPE